MQSVICLFNLIFYFLCSVTQTLFTSTVQIFHVLVALFTCFDIVLMETFPPLMVSFQQDHSNGLVACVFSCFFFLSSASILLRCLSPDFQACKISPHTPSCFPSVDLVQRWDTHRPAALPSPSPGTPGTAWPWKLWRSLGLCAWSLRPGPTQKVHNCT